MKAGIIYDIHEFHVLAAKHHQTAEKTDIPYFCIHTCQLKYYKLPTDDMSLKLCHADVPVCMQLNNTEDIIYYFIVILWWNIITWFQIPYSAKKIKGVQKITSTCTEPSKLYAMVIHFPINLENIYTILI